MDFARALSELGVEIVSTGGTAAELERAGIATRPIEDYTGFPEILDGRVKTLHPVDLRRAPGDPLEGRAPRDACRAPHRADRPGLREPLSVRAHRRAARRHRGRGDRAHRHRRPDADPRCRQEPRVRRGGGQAGELRRRHGRASRGRRCDLAADAPVTRNRGLRRHRPLRRLDLALVRRARGRVPPAPGDRIREGARPLLRREPPPARGLL